MATSTAVSGNDKASTAASPEPRRQPAPVAALERRLRFLTKRQLIEQLRLRELQGEEAGAAAVAADRAAAAAQAKLQERHDDLAARLDAALARAGKAEAALRVEKVAYTNQTLKKHVLGDKLKQSERNAALAQGQLRAERAAHLQQRQARRAFFFMAEQLITTKALRCYTAFDPGVHCRIVLVVMLRGSNRLARGARTTRRICTARSSSRASWPTRARSRPPCARTRSTPSSRSSAS